MRAAANGSFGSPSHAYVPCGQNIETVEKAGSYPGRAPSICCKAAQLQGFASCKDQMVKAAEAREQLPVWWTRSCSCGNEYLAAENRILKAQLSGTERATLGVIGHRLGSKALGELERTVEPRVDLGSTGQLRTLAINVILKAAMASPWRSLPLRLVLERCPMKVCRPSRGDPMRDPV